MEELRTIASPSEHQHDSNLFSTAGWACGSTRMRRRSPYFLLIPNLQWTDSEYLRRDLAMSRKTRFTKMQTCAKKWRITICGKIHANRWAPCPFLQVGSSARSKIDKLSR